MEQEQTKDLREINKKVTDILHFLIGNELDKSSGLVSRMKLIEEEQEKIEKKVDKLEKLKDKIFWVFIGMSFPAGVGAWELIKNIFSS